MKHSKCFFRSISSLGTCFIRKMKMKRSWKDLEKIIWIPFHHCELNLKMSANISHWGAQHTCNICSCSWSLVKKIEKHLIYDWVSKASSLFSKQGIYFGHVHNILIKITKYNFYMPVVSKIEARHFQATGIYILSIDWLIDGLLLTY